MEQCLIDDKELKSEELTEAQLKAKAETCRTAVKKLIVARAVCKRKITLILNSLASAAEDVLTKEYYLEKKSAVDGYLIDIKTLDSEIIATYSDYDMLVLESTLFDKEVDSQASYASDVQQRMAAIRSSLGSACESVNISQILNSTEHAQGNSLPLFREARPPPLECGTFTGKELDKFAYTNFLTQFKNVIDSQKTLSNSAKLSYLKGYCKDYAAQVISHLTVSDDNYQVALQLLNNEFLDREYVIDETFKQILNSSPKFDTSYQETKVYLNKIRSLLHELKGVDVDFFVLGSAGNKLVSHIIYSKLPPALRRELTHKVNSNYPNFNDIFEHYNECIKTINRSSINTNQKRYSTPKIASNPTKSYYRSQSNSSTAESQSTLQNFKTVIEQTDTKLAKSVNHLKPCKFCLSAGHPLYKCKKYPSIDSRLKRCSELKLCSHCTSPKHVSDKCPGNDRKLSYECFACKSKQHISALCPVTSNESHANVCLNHNQNSVGNYLLPIVNIKLARGKHNFKARCLLDTGSQRSYFSDKLLKTLQCSSDSLSTIDFEVKTFLSSETRQFSETMIEVHLPGVGQITMPLLVDRNFKLTSGLPGLGEAIANIVQLGYELADPELANDVDSFELDGLVGVDIIQFFPSLTKFQLINGFAFKTEGGVIPFGNIDQFLYPSQIKPATVLQHDSDRTLNIASLVNFVLEPKKSFFNPLGAVFTDSMVDHGLEQLFSLESLGIKEAQSMSSLDELMIEKFSNSVEFKDGKYYVDLPWYDQIKSVPSNHQISLTVLDRVCKSLDDKGLTDSYQQIFHQQLADGVIEEIEVDPANYGDYIWIPHRPVLKMDEQVTTKIRPVFNCSLRVNGTPSLNDAAYTGLDLMANLVQLLLHFRSNAYVLLSDVKQAFLQIKLRTVADKNRFCFFWKEGDRLVTYRYTTIVFGFTSSPFILNYLIKLHASKYPQDLYSHILSNHFYVDNMIFSTNEPDTLTDVYRESLRRMSDGGFDLRSWSTNNTDLKSLMEEEGTDTQHSSPFEKVLGYSYEPNKDVMCLSDFVVDSNASTKRSILSNISKVFDPLSLCSPVTIRGRLIMKTLWESKADWDDPVSPEIKSSWQSLCADLVKLKCISFPRNSFNSSKTNSLHIFCDASKKVYGFVAYAVNEEESHLIFSKSKMAPSKSRSIPTLELLSVVLALKCLPTIMESNFNIEFTDITIAVDAQVVLSWVVSGEPKTRNIFVRNRIKEITEIAKGLTIPISFKYVNTSMNPADMATRGLSFEKFNSNLSFWLTGPEWLSVRPLVWPDCKLDCLSDETKVIVNKDSLSTYLCDSSAASESIHASADVKDIQCIFKVDNYSNIQKLFRIASFVFKFINKLRKSKSDPEKDSKVYLLKIMQRECYPKELAFLSAEVKEKAIPPLVDKLNLFIDDDGLIRSRGRISKTLHYNYEVLNPILLAKTHHLTALLIDHYHRQCKHLGIQTTLNVLRTSGFWVPRGRQTVKKVIAKCVLCQKFNNFSFRYPKMTNMPKGRMNLVKPFQHTGLDYTGHVMVHDETTGTSKKMFILIYTCLNIRAIHMDLLPDMSVESFLMSFTRFCNQYGIPSHIYSDNAKTFIAGGSFIEDSISSTCFVETLKVNSIKHVRIPLYSAWVGSTWERLIRVVKSCMFKTVGRAKLTYFQLLTALSDIQNAVNSRPLTYRSSDNDLEAITPNCFIKLHANPSLLFRTTDDSPLWKEDPPSQSALDATLTIRDEAFNHFKSIWYQSYLLGLREQNRQLYQCDWVNKVKVGDVVNIKLPNKTRPFWLLGRILEVIPGDDGNIRSVKLKRGDGAICHHSLNHLYPLELSLTHSNTGEYTEPLVTPSSGLYSDTDVKSCSFQEEPPLPEQRPARRAKSKFKDFMQERRHLL